MPAKRKQQKRRKGAKQEPEPMEQEIVYRDPPRDTQDGRFSSLGSTTIVNGGAE
jgi:hypothetical protein